MRMPMSVVSTLAILVFSGVGLAQDRISRFERQIEQLQRETRLKANVEVPPGQRLLIDYGGVLSFDFLSIDDNRGDNFQLRQYKLTGFLQMDLDGVHQLYLRGHTRYKDWKNNESLDPHGDDWVEPTLDRAVYRFDLQRSMAAYEGKVVPWNVVLEAGRRLVHWGNGLGLSQELDGGSLALTYDPVTIEFLGGTTRRSVADIDSSRPGFDGDTRRNFYGAMMSVQAGANHRPYIYGLVQEDDNKTVASVLNFGGGPVSTSFGYDSHYIGVGSQGSLGNNLIYGVEAVYQGGKTFSNSFDPTTLAQVQQTYDHINAFAFDVRLDYLFRDANQSRVSGEVLLATGDDDRLLHTTDTLGGNAPGTIDRSFNSFGYINTGLAFAPRVSNLVMFRVGASTFPLPSSKLFNRLQVGTDLFAYGKQKSGGPIDEATKDTFWSGFETDVYATWQITSDLTWAVRYGVFFPGEAITGSKEARHLVFSSVSLAF